MSRKHRKTARTVPPISRNQVPFPGPQGMEIFEKLMAGETKEALDLFWDAYIAELGDYPPILVIEDDGKSIIFEAERGLFKLSGPARDLLITIITAMENAIAAQNQPQASPMVDQEEVSEAQQPDESQTS
jgi:hypothetical protein